MVEKQTSTNLHIKYIPEFNHDISRSDQIQNVQELFLPPKAYQIHVSYYMSMLHLHHKIQKGNQQNALVDQIYLTNLHWLYAAKYLSLCLSRLKDLHALLYL